MSMNCTCIHLLFIKHTGITLSKLISLDIDVSSSPSKTGVFYENEEIYVYVCQQAHWCGNSQSCRTLLTYLVND